MKRSWIALRETTDPGGAGCGLPAIAASRGGTILEIGMTAAETTVRAQARRAVALALVAGCVDAYALVTFGVFTSFMSGNTTSVAVRAVQGRALSALRHLVPIPAFLLGAFAGAQRSFRLICGLVAALLAVAAFLAGVAPHRGWLGVVVLSLAMGALSTAVRQVGAQTVNVGFVTGDLIRLGTNLASGVRRQPVADAQGPWDTHGWRAGILAAIWAAILLGALLGGILAVHFGVLALALPGAILLILTARGTGGDRRL